MKPNKTGTAVRRLDCVIVEDDREQRILLESCLKMAGVEVVAEAHDGIDAIRVLLQMKPAFAFVDLKLPGASGTDVIAKTRRKLPETKFIVLTGATSPELLDAIIGSGADAVITKPYDPSEIIKSIDEVGSGRHYLGSRTISIVWDRFAAHSRAEAADTLTARQIEIVRLIALGHSTKQAADYLEIAVRTAEKHRELAMKKIGARCVADVARYALRMGLTT